MASTVHVENISSQTSEKEVRDFFSFCGKISNLSVTATGENTQSASVTFEKDTAAKTALLLDHTQLGPAQVHVSAAKSLDELAGKSTVEDENKDHDDVPQEDKPRSRIVAEYLAHGYHISDKAIEKAIALDQQHGISTRFTTALKAFDDKTKATERAAAVDQKFGVTTKAAQGWRSMNSYFDMALGTPTGQKLRRFYEEGNKQVVDVHNEARHLADLKGGKGEKATPEKVEGSDRTQCSCSSEVGKCGCAPGTCACSSCAKNPDAEASREKAGVEEAGLHKAEGSTG